jgi:2-iminobutanoate/2-iminopropanoate deaminase
VENSRRELYLSTLSEPISHYTHAVIHGNLVFVSGCIGVTRDREIADLDAAMQCDQVLRNLGEILAQAGSSFAEVLKVTIYLRDIEDRRRINPVREKHFGDARPASTLIEISKLAHPQALVEIDVIAAIPDTN